MRPGRSLASSLLAAALLTAATAHAAVQQDQLVSGGGPCGGSGSQIAWSALGEPLGGSMSGGGFIVNGGGFPPPAGSSPPVIIGFWPNDKSRCYQQEKDGVWANATDPNNDPLEYRFLIDGGIVQDWSPLNSIDGNWDTTNVVFGWHILRVEVRDAEHTVSQEHRAFIFHRPPSPS